MTTNGFDAWLTEVETVIAKRLPARDSRWWQASFWSGVLIFVATKTNLLPDQWQPYAIDIAAVIGTIGGKFGWSSAKAPDATTVREAQETQRVINSTPSQDDDHD